MTAQRSLFDPQPKARGTDPNTSHVAAAMMSRSVVRAQRDAIHVFLLRNGPAIADEIDAALGYRVTTAGRRLKELSDLGLVTMLEETRKTRSGRPARLWRGIVLP